jgi:hypothetical protein
VAGDGAVGEVPDRGIEVNLGGSWSRSGSGAESERGYMLCSRGLEG